MEVLCAQREQERLAAHKWLQALDNQVRLLSQKSEQPLTLESFAPHFRHFLTPHQPGDIRHVGPNGATVQRGKDHLCAAGMSAAAWWRSDAPLLCHFVWDKLHRVANDLKLSKSKTQNEVMLKTVFIWGANYRRFRSGGFFTEKQEVICAFLASESWESWFRSSSRWLSLFFVSSCCVAILVVACFPRTARSFNPMSTRLASTAAGPQEYLFNNLMDVAQSFVLKGPMPKTGRWLSWHQSAEVNLKEFHAAKMLLQWYFPSEPDPEESTGKTFASSFKDVGGLKLVYRCMTRQVYELSHVLLAVSKPCWRSRLLPSRLGTLC